MTNVHQGSDLDQIVDEMITHMKTQIENPALLNSRFRFDEVLFLDVNFHWLNLTTGSSYFPRPDWIARKKAIINPQNDDKECFKWAVITASKWMDIKFNPEHMPNLRKFTDNYDWSGLRFPVSIKDISMFENKNGISVNVLVVEDRDIYINSKSDHKSDREINLLLISEGPTDPATTEQGAASGDGRWHYTAIKSLSRLLASKNSKNKGKQYFCINCLQGFKFELSRDKHYAYCVDYETVRVEMPRKGSTLEFYDGQNQFKVPFMMYMDFEAILEPMQGPRSGPCDRSPDPEEPYTKKVNQHIPSGLCVYRKFAYGDVKDPLTIYRGEDCVKRFCDHIMNEARRLYSMFPEVTMDPLTNKQWKSYKRSSKCHICYNLFKGFDPKVRDHCHYTGKYRGPTHRNCSLRYRIPSYIPVVFHNLSGYDAHLFIKELGSKSSNIEVIAKNREDYITFSVDVMVDRYTDKNGDERDKFIKLQFIDSFKFMASSLDSLTNNLVRGGRKLTGFEDYSKSQYELLVRKGIYPYEYVSSWDKFEETQLSPIEAFYSNLNMSNIGEDDYQHAKKVWSTFSINNLGEYHNLYLSHQCNPTSKRF